MVMAFMFTFVLVQSVIIDAGTPTIVTLGAVTQEDKLPSESNQTGDASFEHTLSNLTDGNLTTYVVTRNNLTYYYTNFTKLNDSNSSSVVQIRYNTTLDAQTTNYTFSDYTKCWINNAEKVQIRLISNYTQNLSTYIIVENFTWVNGTAVSLDNTRAVSAVVYNKTVRFNIINETNKTNSDLVWNNGTNITLLNTNTTDSIRIFNCSVATNINNETNITNSNLVWKNGTNVSVAQTFGVSAIDIYNCSVRNTVTNESNATNSELVWINGTNMTLANPPYSSAIVLMNCTPPHVVVGAGNYTNYGNGNIFATANTTVHDGGNICINYTFQGLGYGTEINSSGNYTFFENGNIYMISNSTFQDGLGFCINYTYLGDGFGAELGSGNYTLYGDGNVTMISNTTIPDGTKICANYSYHGIGFGDVIPSANYTLNYTPGTITLTSNLHSGTQMGVNYTYMSDATPFNRRQCYNGSKWINLGTDTGRAEIFDIRMFWKMFSRSLNFSFSMLIPSAYSIQNSTSVVINLTTIDYSADNNHTYWNCSLYNKSNRDGNYSANAAWDDKFITNGSTTNITLTLNDGGRYYWYIGCEDEFKREIANSTMRAFDVDVDYNVMKMGDGEINFTFVDGDIGFKGTLRGGDIAVVTSTIDTLTSTTTTISSQLNINGNMTLINTTEFAACNSTRDGDMIYNLSAGKLLFCNSSGWQKLY